MSKKKKTGLVIAIVAVIVIALGVLGFFIFKGLGAANAVANGEAFWADNVGDMCGYSIGSVSRFSGKVEAQESLEVKKDASKTVKDILVEVGQEVEVGTPLFTYDTTEISNQINAINLEIEGLNNNITSYNSQIQELETQKASAPADLQLEYTTQIQELQISVQQANYDIKSKNAEKAGLTNSLENSTVKSTMAGVVKTINTDDAANEYGNDQPFITILATGDYRVCGKIDEQSLGYGAITEGQPVIIRSRVDESVTWTGVISLIDTENEAKDEGQNYYDDSDSGENTTNYPFYVELDSTEGLLLGQHVFIEPDFGQQEVTSGIQIDESYIVFDEEQPYVWAVNSKDKIEKRYVELGAYNENMWTYEIVSGLTEEDYIVWPMEGVEEGKEVMK